MSSTQSESPSARGNHPALRSCWHPVAYAEEVSEAPVPAELLGEPLVVWRDSGGTAHVFSDLCIHRGTALSLGTVEGDEIVCPYHGWRYEASGACVAIPQLADPTRVPAKARATRYEVVERFGIVWAALESPRLPLPDVPELEFEEWRTVSCGPYEWRCDASRQVENFTDFGHFPFVHPGLLGDPERPVVPAHEVRIEGSVLHYEIVRPEAPNTDDFPVFANVEKEVPERRSRYELHLPYTIVLRLGWGGEEGMLYFFVSQPVREDRCKGFLRIGRNYNFEQPDEVLRDFEDVIFDQDKRVVESQRPEQVPFDLAAELHLKFDAVAVAYRRAMRAEGLAL
ncbi:MAG TPA: aromatic ring-hydroxylating dioxygenase subunit alpha [Gaiellaceae bacterium]|nr:aromatic ring-hydroxylating dioxygenase subunit alpha [Gaiellaceae bacterium]